MRPPRINEGVAFGPGVLQVVPRAFDEAWASIGPLASKFGYPIHIVCGIAPSRCSRPRKDSSDVGMIRDAGVRAIQLNYPLRFEGRGPRQASAIRETNLFRRVASCDTGQVMRMAGRSSDTPAPE